MSAQTAISPPTPEFDESYQLEHAVGFGTILVVDDHPLLRDLVAEGLRINGYRVECAEDGEEAWDALCRKDFDLLITDQNMPRLTGLDLLRRVKSSPFVLPTILMSAELPTEVEGFDGIIAPGAALAKPFSLAQLLNLVNAVLLSHRQVSSFRPRA